MLLVDARALADRILRQIEPFCLRVEIAGSIRRGKDEVKDIELVAIPRWEERADPTDLFGERRIQENQLHQWALSEECGVQWIKPGTTEIVPWHVEATGKYWRGILPESIKLDLFLCEPDNWGAIFLIRTGSSSFSYAVATHAKNHNCPFRDGWLTWQGEAISTPEEQDVFDVLNLEWCEPSERLGWQSLRARLQGSQRSIPTKAQTKWDERFIWRDGDIEIIQSEDIGDSISPDAPGTYTTL